ncbi:MAG: hypothetical protein IKW89_02660 [Bacteroidales bacterium]|nr:hypothetical protein [Bacteroidales bacterium]
MSKRGRINLKKLKKNADGLYEITAYTLKNLITMLYYCGVTSHPENRKSVWKGLNNRYAGKKINDARKKYGVGEDVWKYEETIVLVADINDVIATMDDVETALILKYDSYRNGYNSNLGGPGRGSKGHVSVSIPGVGTVVYNSCEDAAAALCMSPGIVYYYAYTSKTHKKKANGYVFNVVAPSWTTSISTRP